MLVIVGGDESDSGIGGILSTDRDWKRAQQVRLKISNGVEEGEDHEGVKTSSNGSDLETCGIQNQSKQEVLNIFIFQKLQSGQKLRLEVNLLNHNAIRNQFKEQSESVVGQRLCGVEKGIEERANKGEHT